MGNIYIEVKVTLYFAMSQNGQIHFQRVNIMTIAPTMFMQFLVISTQISNMV